MNLLFKSTLLTAFILCSGLSAMQEKSKTPRSTSSSSSSTISNSFGSFQSASPKGNEKTKSKSKSTSTSRSENPKKRSNSPSVSQVVPEDSFSDNDGSSSSSSGEAESTEETSSSENSEGRLFWHSSFSMSGKKVVEAAYDENNRLKLTQVDDEAQIIDMTHEASFFAPEYGLEGEAKQFINVVAHKLLGQERLNQQENKKLAKHRGKLEAWAEAARPRIVLQHKEDAEASNEQKKYKIVPVSEVEGTPLSTEKVSKVIARLNGEQQGFDLRRTVRTENKKNQKNTDDTISLDAPGTCLAYNMYNNMLYIGCANGHIYTYDVAEKRFGLTFSGHTKPLSALHLLRSGTGFISIDADKRTKVWSTRDVRNRITLDNVDFSETYVSPQENMIIRSHIGGKSLTSSWIGSRATLNGIYTLPEGYLQGTSPGSDIRKIAFLWLLKKVQNKERLDVERVINDMASSSVLNTFEPSVTRALKMQIERHTTPERKG